MPRPTKWRKVCSEPRGKTFGPVPGRREGREKIIMTVDEYESIRLIDHEGLTQEECAAQMDVARTTVQAIYKKARKKLADSIVNDKMIIVAGGDYKICEEDEKCMRGVCPKRKSEDV